MSFVSVKKKRMKTGKVVLLVLMLLFLAKSIIAPPEPRTVKGTVFKSNGVAQAESGLDVFINDTNSSKTATTKTYGPPVLPGIYSAVLNSSVNDLIYVRAWNATVWGYHYGIMGAAIVTIDVLLNLTRSSEAKVIILNPANHTSYSSPNRFNVTANITILGNNGVNCNATIAFSVPGILQLDIGETYTHNLGNIQRTNSIITFWNLTAYGDGSTNITVFSRCGSDGAIIENLNYFSIYNISSLDLSPPVIYIISPLNNSKTNNPVVFYYNVTDGSLITNCILSINNVTVNTTNNPTRNIISNFTNILSQRTNYWEINCTDSTISQSKSSTGLFNLTLNYFPSITSIIADTPVNLIAASTKTVYCNGTASDGEGYSDITKINASLFYYTKTPSSQDNSSNHYSNSSCALFNGAGNTIDFRCAFDLQYYANNGTWYCNASIIDTINSTNSTQAQMTVNDLLAIGVYPESIDFGALQIMQISPSDIIVNVTNYGNVMLDLNLYAYALFQNDNLSMDCTQGNISLDYERFSLIYDTNYNSMSNVNNSITPAYANFNLAKREGGSLESRKPVYWKLQIPMEASGRCNGKIVFTALSG